MIESPDDVPNVFLLSYVTPIPKIPKPLNVENFRPISGTSDVLKTLERCIKIVLVEFLEQRNYFPKQKYGFRAKKSTIKQLIPFQEFIISSVSKKMTVDVIYFDLLKAFDKIPISRLIRALKKAGITGNLLKIIITLLSFRKFKVKVGKTFSETFNATSGVPQGSVLGPVLFIIFITELSDILSTLPGILHLLFADDLKIYFAYFKNSFEISIIQNAINAVFNWSSENSMTTSTSKTFHMQYGPKNEDAKYFINNTPISTVTIVRDLGIMLENNLQPHAHIKKIVGSAMASMFSIIKRVLISSTDVLIFLFNVYVRPILEYGTQLFNIQQKKIANYLERPQKLFTRILYRRQHKFGIIPSYPSRLKLYKIKSLHERRNIIDMETAYDYLHSNLPNDSSLRFTPNYNTRFKKSYSTTEKLTNKYRLTMAVEIYKSYLIL
uniref:Reverse transcriptase domain-containing protein n=1 Tax=Panagrolaimus davidi TaxID=227884 RepID=A0A914QGR1_9BILA